MTTRNLNRTWTDIVFAQYAADHEADVPYPIRYLIKAPQWKTDIWINVAEKTTDLLTLKRSFKAFFLARHTSGNPTWEDDFMSIKPRNRSMQRSEVDEVLPPTDAAIAPLGEHN
jgi:hypothetical protein